MLCACNAQLDFLFSTTFLKRAASLLSNQRIFAPIPGISVRLPLEQSHKSPVSRQDKITTQILLLPRAEISCLSQVPSENLLKTEIKKGKFIKKSKHLLAD